MEDLKEESSPNVVKNCYGSIPQSNPQLNTCRVCRVKEPKSTKVLGERNMKKKIVLLIMVFCFFCLSVGDNANARGRWEGFWPGCCIGGVAGCTAAQVVRPQPVVVEPPPPMCFRDVPGHWVARWNPYTNSYEQVWIPGYRESYPCR